MLFYLLKWLITIPLGIILYLYDDMLWGPAPIALSTKVFGWPHGFIGLCFMYFVISFIACFAVLTHYAKKKKASHKSWLKKSSGKRRGVVHHILLTSRWVGLAVSCFMLGAILTSIPVGKFKLFDDIRPALLAAIMSFLFVFLFMGFYGGLASFTINFGLISAALLFLLGYTTLALGSYIYTKGHSLRKSGFR